MTDERILDPCCGSRMFWFDRKNPDVVFADSRSMKVVLCDGRVLDIHPDMIADVRHLPFADETFCHVVFDPPHLIRGGDSSWLVQKYGKLPDDWEKFIHDGFAECWRVLKTDGTLNFKWNQEQIPTSEVIKTIGREPLYGNRMRGTKTDWLVFVK